MKTHKQVALDNFKNADDAPTTEWSITMYFYAAVHAVNHAIHGKNLAPMDYRHEQRRLDIQSKPSLISIGGQYAALEALSQEARYLPQSHPMPLPKKDHARNLAQVVLQAAGLKP